MSEDQERREDVARLFDSVPGETPASVRDRARELASRLEGASEPLPLAAGDSAGSYEVLEVLGSGGQAVVYRARHRHIGRTVALKVPRKAVAERLLREAKLAAALAHDSIARVEDVCLDGPVPYMVLELCEGGSLERLLERRADPLPLEHVREIARAVLEALAFAHERGVVHRDVKPANILFDEKGKAKVADFGIGTLAHSAELDHTLGASQATRGAGTPLFMAPEQEDAALRAGGQLDGRADLFAFGKVLFQLLTGASPRTLRPPSRLRAGLDPRWDELVFKLTEERPEKRLASAREALAELEAIAASVPAREPSPGYPPVQPSPPVRAKDPLARARFRARVVAAVLTGLLLLGGYFTFSAGYMDRQDPRHIVCLVGGAIALAGLATALLGVSVGRAASPSGWAVLLGSHGFAGIFTGGIVAWDALERLHGTEGRARQHLLELVLFVAVPLAGVGAALAVGALRWLRPPELVRRPLVDPDPFPGARFAARTAATILTGLLLLAAWVSMAWALAGYARTVEELSLAELLGAALGLSGLATLVLGERARGAFRPRPWALVMGSLGGAAFFAGSALNLFMFLETPWGSRERLRLLLFVVVPLIVTGLALVVAAFRLLRSRRPDDELEPDELHAVPAAPVALAPVAQLAPAGPRPSLLRALLLGLGAILSAGLAYLGLVVAIVCVALLAFCLLPLQLLGGSRHADVHFTGPTVPAFVLLEVGLAGFAVFLAFLSVRALWRAVARRSA